MRNRQDLHAGPSGYNNAYQAVRYHQGERHSVPTTGMPFSSKAGTNCRLPHILRRSPKVALPEDEISKPHSNCCYNESGLESPQKKDGIPAKK
jgi:hypothetical protein